MTYRIAFLRYKDSKQYIKDKYPDNMIVEFELFDKHTAPYECLLEQDFSNEWKKQLVSLENFINSRVNIQVAHNKYLMDALVKDKENNHKEYKLWLQFLDWKKNIDETKADIEKERIRKLWNEKQGLPPLPYKQKEFTNEE
jgi:hypothetical protein